MARRDRDKTTSPVHAALDAMDADELRAVLHMVLESVDDQLRARLESEVVSRAAQTSGGWTPTEPSEARVQQLEAFVAAARESGWADPDNVDDWLQEGMNAFLSGNPRSALRIYGALLPPVSGGDIFLGQDEMVEEVLGVDVDSCAKQYVVAVYLTTELAQRARAVAAAIDDVRGTGFFFEPLAELESAAAQPLPDFDAFLVDWHRVVEKRVASADRGGWNGVEDRWLHEAVSRLHGPAGLAQIARGSRRTGDLRAWCDAVVAAGDWRDARAAYEEAAELASDDGYARGHFLDGAALAAQELSAPDFTKCLEQAWRRAPTLPRLQRWLGQCETSRDLFTRCGVALDQLSPDHCRQRALLHLLRGELADAAAILADAPGLGWSAPTHAGHLAFPVFVAMLTDAEVRIEVPATFDDTVAMLSEDGPVLHAPSLEHLIQLAEPAAPDEPTRVTIIDALQRATERRASGITENKRRRHYQHVATLAVQCATADGTPTGKEWLQGLRDQYRRYTALQREFRAAGAE